jgi:nucleoside-diphosphate-sugar epimerase
VKILITGAAGNLGSFLTHHLLEGPHQLNLLLHQKELDFNPTSYDNISVYRADLNRPDTLEAACRGVDCIVHFAGTLFAPFPERFLPTTNIRYVENLVAVAKKAAVKKFILISFPHVEGESTPESPAPGSPDGSPESVHARTRLAAEKVLFSACEGSQTVAVALRPGMIYARGVLMIDAARWLSEHYLLSVWKKPTWIHLLALPDFLSALTAAIENKKASGIYNLGDDAPLTLQEFLETAAGVWGTRKPWRLPRWMFFVAGLATEIFAWIFGTAAPLTRDFIRIGMVSYTADTTRMQEELLPVLAYARLEEGLDLLR